MNNSCGAAIPGGSLFLAGFFVYQQEPPKARLPAKMPAPQDGLFRLFSTFRWNIYE
jgi:hypothetical protein